MAYAPNSTWNPCRRPEEVDRNAILYGFADFALYALVVAFAVQANAGLFGLWAALAPLTFMMVCTPIGPVSAAYWSGSRAVSKRPSTDSLADAELVWIEARMNLKALECETRSLESEMLALGSEAETVPPALTKELEATRELRARIEFEILRVDGQLAFIQDAKRLALVCGAQ